MQRVSLASLGVLWLLLFYTCGGDEVSAVQDRTDNDTLANLSGANESNGSIARSSKPCRKGRLRTSADGHETCTCSWPRAPQATLDGLGTDCVLMECGHGSYNFSEARCGCDTGWRHAGITNPLQFVLGSCTQYRCETDAVCEEQLGVPGATCPVAGWNCDCGLLHSLSGNAHAQCMYPWWAVASQVTKAFLALLRHLWLYTLVMAAVLLPFGKNVMGTADRYSAGLLQHDLAWSLFSVKLGAWLYAFCTVLYLCVALFFLAAGVVLLTVILVVVLTVACLMACLAVSGEGGGGGSSCDVGEMCSCDCAAEECGACEFGECCECAGCNDSCCSLCCGGGAADADLGPMVLYSYEPCWCYYPYGGLGPTSSECDCLCFPRSRGQGPRTCSNRCWTLFAWIPCFRKLVAVAPRLPENMLGGLLGLVIGTHPLRNRYDQNSCVVRVLARPCWSLSNRGDVWRQTVYVWLHEREASEITEHTGMQVAEARESDSTHLLYGGVVVEREVGFFSAAERIFNFSDYERNECWICQQPGKRWDLWFSCRHVFCERCSAEMLRRQMPCPFCRVRSSRVIRRSARQEELRAEAVGLPQPPDPEDVSLLEARASPVSGGVVHRGPSRCSSNSQPEAATAVHAPEQVVPMTRRGTRP